MSTSRVSDNSLLQTLKLFALSTLGSLGVVCLQESLVAVAKAMTRGSPQVSRHPSQAAAQVCLRTSLKQPALRTAQTRPVQAKVDLGQQAKKNQGGSQAVGLEYLQRRRKQLDFVTEKYVLRL